MTIIWCTDPEISSMTNRIFMLFWTTFCSFTPLTTWKIKIKKKKKKKRKNLLEMSFFYNSAPKIMIIWYTVPEICMVCDKCNCYFSFLTIFCPFIPLTAQKIKVKKKWKKILEILPLWRDVVRFLRYGARQTDGEKSDM